MPKTSTETTQHYFTLDRIDRIMSGTDRTWPARGLRLLTGLAEPLFYTAVKLRNKAYDLGLTPSHPLGRPTISVGNITTGGTGKTPLVAYLAEQLIEAGHQPAILMRGYRQGSSAHSDEQRLLMNLLPTTPVIANPDRRRGAQTALTTHPETTHFILDDGFQHRRVDREINFVLIDATNPFGYDHLLPRGLLREPLTHLNRATGLILTRADQLTDAQRHTLIERITSLTDTPIIAQIAYAWDHLLDEHDTQHPLPSAHESSDKPRVLLVAAIGNPQALIRQAEQSFDLAACDILPDHADYTHDQLLALKARLTDLGAQAVLTTEKDWVKIAPLLKKHSLSLTVWRPQQRVTFLTDPQHLNQTLLKSPHLLKSP